MKKGRIRIAALFMSILLLLALLPAQAFADEAGTGEVPAAGEEAAACAVRFLCTPEDADLTVRGRGEDGSAEDAIPQEEDGTRLLAEGEYFLSASRDGFESIDEQVDSNS